jgi:hypothetical protein
MMRRKAASRCSFSGIASFKIFRLSAEQPAVASDERGIFDSGADIFDQADETSQYFYLQ